MNYIKNNKELLLKYLFILITNILIYIFCSFYLKSSNYTELIMLIITVVIDLIIYHYKGTTAYKWYLDYIINFIIGLILMFFIKNLISYGTVLFSLFFANNIVFIKSRLSDKFLMKTLQYLLMFIYTVISLFINMCIFSLLF